MLILLAVLLSVAASCQKNNLRVVSLDSFQSLKVKGLHISNECVKKNILRLADEDRNQQAPDLRAKAYYRNNGCLIWITRHGVSGKADSLLNFLKSVNQHGFDREKFRYSQIKEDLKSVRSLSFEGKDDKINRVLARLEYNLTKAYFRYAVGFGRGFINPNQVFNRLDVKDSDSVGVKYRTLFGIKMKHAGNKFYGKAVNMALHDSVGSFLRQLQPKGNTYYLLKSRLMNVKCKSERSSILCNMERCRWRLEDSPAMHNKYMVVNIPSQRLLAINGGHALSMKIGLGALLTKTPLLTSRISRIDFNPQWIIPRSIIRKSILAHVGNKEYFERNNYFVVDRRSGKVVDQGFVDREMLLDRNYAVIQRGGAGNALGSVIFRFANDFSIFIHYTSNTDIFLRNERTVSHGCIRIEKPFDLVLFCLEDFDEKLVSRIKFTMNYYNEQGLVKGSSNDIAGDDVKSNLLNSLKVQPQIPLFITYYTIYPNESGILQYYPDIYGYDKVIYNQLKAYIR